MEEFNHGLQCFLAGKNYIAPDMQEILDGLSEWPDMRLKTTVRQKEVLLMLCNGFTIKRIEDDLHVCKATVENHIKELKKIFNCRGREELIKTAFCLDIVSKKDLCFSDTSYQNTELPDWAKTQQYMNRMEKLKITNCDL